MRWTASWCDWRGRGIGPGSRVLLFVPMSVDLYVALLACFHLGAAAVFLDAWSDRRRLDGAIAAARPDAFVSTPRAHLLRLVSPALRRVPLKLLLSDTARWGEIGGARLAPAAVDPEEPALITLTTGSTGVPRVAARSHGF